MLGLFSRPARRTTVARSPRLALTRLETRDCPAAPALAMNVVPLNGDQALVTGFVSDETPSRVRITLGGVASGTFAPSSTGAFSFITTLSDEGVVLGQAVDREQLYSNLATQAVNGGGNAIKNQPPQIVEFGASNQNGVWVISGRVIDEQPAGLTVTLRSSIAQLNGVTVTTDADGYFSYSFTPTGLFLGGSVTAQTTDDQGLTSDPVATYLG